MPRKIRQLVTDLERAGFTRIHGGKGSHRKFVHPKYPGFVLVSGQDGGDVQHYQEITSPQRPEAGAIMKTQDQYLQFVRWSEEDNAYVGYCPDLFTWGGVCHGATAVEAFTQLSEIVEDAVTTAQAQGLPLPPPGTRPMREAVPA